MKCPYISGSLVNEFLHIRHLLSQSPCEWWGDDAFNWSERRTLVPKAHSSSNVFHDVFVWMCSPSSICICKRSSLIALLMQPAVVAFHRDLALSCPKLDCLTSPLPKYIHTPAITHFSHKVLVTAGARINFLCRTENVFHRYTLSFPAFKFLIFQSTWRPMNSL